VPRLVQPLASDHVTIGQELARKSFHLTLFLVPLWYFSVPGPLGLLGLIIATFAVVYGDVLRIRDPKAKRLFNRYFQSMIRGEEREDLLGSTYYILGAVVTVLLYDRFVAVTALLFLVFGDTAAALAGRRYGKRRYWGKSLAGSAACFGCCVILGAAIFRAPWIAAAGAAAATIAEALPSSIDDNIRIPLVSGIVMQILVKLN
jgi:dolichol kinase